MCSAMLITLGILCGGISQYGPGVMEEPIRNRQRWGQIPKAIVGVHGYLAGRHPEDIGRYVQLRMPGESQWHTFLVTDVASKTDSRWQDGLSGYEWMIRNDIYFEVDYEYLERYRPEYIGKLVCMEWRFAERPVSRYVQ